MELNGAFSNPLETDKSLLERLSEVHRRLVERALRSPREPRERSPRPMALHQVVTLVLADARQSMRVSEIRAAAEQRLGRPLPRTTLKAALAAGVAGDPRRF